MTKKITRHHIVPRSRGGCNEDKNVLFMPDNRHRALHTLFCNAMPHEQVSDLLGWNSKVIIEATYEELMNILASRKFYKSGIVKK